MKVQLGSLYKISSGGTPLKNKKEYYDDGDINWVKTGDLKQQYLYDTQDCITQIGLEKSSAKMYEANTVLVAMYGATIGATSILKIPACTNQACAAFPPVDKVIPEYLYYFLKSKKSKFVNDGVGGAQPNISGSYLKNVEFNLLDLDEQKKIVDLLDKTARIIDYKKEQITLLDNLIKSRFVEMFGDPVSDTMKWGQSPLGNSLKSIKYGTSVPPQFVESGYSFIRATNIKKGKIVPEGMKFIDQEEADKIKKCKMKGQEIIIVRSGVNSGDTCIITDEYIGHYAGYDIILEFDSTINPVFINELINTNYMNLIVKPLTRRAAQPHLNSEQVQSLPILKVPKNKQDVFADFIQQVDKLKVEVRKSLEETQLLFDSLMQKYFEL